MISTSTFKIVLIVLLALAAGFLVSYLYFMSGNSIEEVKFSDNEQNSETASTTETLTPTATTSVSTLHAPAQNKVTEPAPQPKQEVFKLNIPYFHQQYKNSCEASSLRMALGYFGTSVDDMAIVNAFGYVPHLKDVERNIWDDPQKMFVGFVDIASSTAGYGTYGKPVARAAQTFGRTAEYRTSITPQELAAEIKAGHPVVIWGYTSLTQKPYTWNVTDSSGAITGTVKAFHGEHARLVVGILGPVEKPTGFYVHDPMVGAYQYWSSASLMKQFNSVPGVTNQVVILR